MRDPGKINSTADSTHSDHRHRSESSQDQKKHPTNPEITNMCLLFHATELVVVCYAAVANQYRDPAQPGLGFRESS